MSSNQPLVLESLKFKCMILWKKIMIAIPEVSLFPCQLEHFIKLQLSEYSNALQHKKNVQSKNSVLDKHA